MRCAYVLSHACRSFPLSIDLLPLVQETLEELDSQPRVQSAGRGTDRMHAQLWHARVGSFHAERAAQRRTNGATAARVIPDLETLGCDPRQLANPREDGRRNRVGRHVAVRVGADYNAHVQTRCVVVKVT